MRLTIQNIKKIVGKPIRFTTTEEWCVVNYHVDTSYYGFEVIDRRSGKKHWLRLQREQYGWSTNNPNIPNYVWVDKKGKPGTYYNTADYLSDIDNMCQTISSQMKDLTR